MIAMNITLTEEEKTDLESRHRIAFDRWSADRIKAVLRSAEGWSVCKVAQALRLNHDTISRYVIEYLDGVKSPPAYRDSLGKLNDKECEALCNLG